MCACIWMCVPSLSPLSSLYPVWLNGVNCSSKNTNITQCGYTKPIGYSWYCPLYYYDAKVDCQVNSSGMHVYTEKVGVHLIMMLKNCITRIGLLATHECTTCACMYDFYPLGTFSDLPPICNRVGFRNVLKFLFMPPYR